MGGGVSAEGPEQPASKGIAAAATRRATHAFTGLRSEGAYIKRVVPMCGPAPTGDRPCPMEDLDAVLARIDPRLCVQCKAARMLCGIDPCPLLRKVSHHLPKVQVKGRDLMGSSPPSLFVGRYGYPSVSVGPMLPPEHREDESARLLDAPRRWMSMGIPDVVGLRSSLVRTTHKVKVQDAAHAP